MWTSESTILSSVNKTNDLASGNKAKKRKHPFFNFDIGKKQGLLILSTL